MSDFWSAVNTPSDDEPGQELERHEAPAFDEPAVEAEAQPLAGTIDARFEELDYEEGADDEREKRPRRPLLRVVLGGLGLLLVLLVLLSLVSGGNKKTPQQSVQPPVVQQPAGPTAPVKPRRTKPKPKDTTPAIPRQSPIMERAARIIKRYVKEHQSPNPNEPLKVNTDELTALLRQQLRVPVVYNKTKVPVGGISYQLDLDTEMLSIQYRPTSKVGDIAYSGDSYR